MTTNYTTWDAAVQACDERDAALAELAMAYEAIRDLQAENKTLMTALANSQKAVTSLIGAYIRLGTDTPAKRNAIKRAGAAVKTNGDLLTGAMQ